RCTDRRWTACIAVAASCMIRAVPERPKGSSGEQAAGTGQALEGPAGLHHRGKAGIIPLLMRGGAVWQLVGLITRRSQVQILPPLPCSRGCCGVPGLQGGGTLKTGLATAHVPAVAPIPAPSDEK